VEPNFERCLFLRRQGADKERCLHERHRTTCSTTLFGIALGSLDQPLVVFLDNWHTVDGAVEVRRLVEALIWQTANVHCVVASRHIPSIVDFSLLVVRRQCLVIDETLLRFNADEISALLAVEGIACDLQQAIQLESYSEGWVTGLLLVLQATGGNITAVVAQQGRSIALITHLLAEQVFSRQPSAVQQLLCELSLLEELTPENCCRALEYDNIWPQVEKLHAQRLFLSEVGAGVLRFHSLFRDFLRHRLRAHFPERFAAITDRLVRFYIAEERWTSAFKLYLQLGDNAGVRQLLANFGESLYLRDRLETLRNVFTMLPVEILDVPALRLRAEVATELGQFIEAQALLEVAVGRTHGQPPPSLTLQQAMLDCELGRYAEACARAQRVLDTDAEPELHGIALRIIGVSQHRLGRSREAIATLGRAAAVEAARGDEIATAQVQHELMICNYELGNLAVAETIGSQLEGFWIRVGNLGRLALTRNSLAVTRLLAGRHAEAFRDVCQALHHAHQARTARYMAAALSTLGDLFADLGQWQDAYQIYQTAMRHELTAFMRSFLILGQARVLIAQRAYTQARFHLDQYATAIVPQHEPDLLLLRAQIAIGIGDPAAGRRNLRAALDAYQTRGALVDQGRAWAVAAWLELRADPANLAATRVALAEAACCAERLGSHTIVVTAMRTFLPELIAAFPHHPELERWATLLVYLNRVAETLDRSQIPHLPALAVSPPQQTAHAVIAPSPSSRFTLHGHFLGRCELAIKDTPLVVGTGRLRQLLTYLMLHTQGCSREVLYRELWDTDEVPDSLDALSRMIYRLRALLPRGAITTINRETYMLNPLLLDVSLDVHHFEQAVRQMAQFTDGPSALEVAQRAVRLYSGPFLPDVETAWCMRIRGRLERQFRHAQRVLAEQLETAGKYQDALDIFEQLAAYDPTNSIATAGVMRCHIALGSPARAIQQYFAMKQVLYDELGINLDENSEPEVLYRSLLGPK